MQVNGERHYRSGDLVREDDSGRLHFQGRVTYVSATDDDALAAFQLCSKLEGILPALEPSHALAYVMQAAPKLPATHLMVMNMCGRGDKDVFTIAEAMGAKL